MSNSSFKYTYLRKWSRNILGGFCPDILSFKLKIIEPGRCMCFCDCVYHQFTLNCRFLTKNSIRYITLITNIFKRSVGHKWRTKCFLGWLCVQLPVCKCHHCYIPLVTFVFHQPIGKDILVFQTLIVSFMWY